MKEEAASGEHGGDSAARAYALHLIENSLARRDAQDPVGQASEAYKLIVQLVGERDLTEAGATLQKARHDANGHLDEYVPIGECPLLPLSGAATRADPLFVFTYLLTSYDDRGYAIGAYLDNFYPQYAWMWREAEQGTEALDGKSRKESQTGVLIRRGRVTGKHAFWTYD